MMQDQISRIENGATALVDFPQVQALLSLSAREAGRAEALGILAGQSALRVRIETLAQGVADVAELAAAGLGTDNLSDGAAGLHRLATGVVQDLRGLLEKAVQERTMAIEMAAEEIVDKGPIDLTAEMKAMAVMPAPVLSDRPGIVVDAGPWDDHAYGRVSGDFLIACVKPWGADGVAPENSIAIPAGMMVRMEAGESFRIHARGQREGDSRSGAPLDKETESFIIALDKGVDVHGPAVIMPRKKVNPDHVKGLHEKIRKLLDLKKSIEEKNSYGYFIFVSGIFSSMLFTIASAVASSENESGVLNIFTLLTFCSLLLMAASIKMTRAPGKKLTKKVGPEFIEQIVQGFSYFSATTFPKGWTLKNSGTNIDEKIYKDLEAVSRVTGGMNFRPYRKMWTTDGKARILKPLPALPAPDNVTTLDLGAERRKATA